MKNSKFSVFKVLKIEKNHNFNFFDLTMTVSGKKTKSILEQLYEHRLINY